LAQATLNIHALQLQMDHQGIMKQGHGATPHLLRLASFVQDVVDHLESSRKALTAEELREAVQHDVVGNKELYDVLAINPKIRINPDGRYEYKVSGCSP